MTLKEIVKRLSNLTAFETRHIGDDYCEIVFSTADREELDTIFTDIFGPPAKPTDKNPDASHIRLTKDFGGIRYHQKLFKKELGEITIIAMFWPWKNNYYITVKLAVLKNKDIEKDNKTGSIITYLLGRIRKKQ